MIDDTLKILEVQNSILQDEFIKFPWKIYHEDSIWVPPLVSELKKQLSKEKNPIFKYCKVKFWIAKQNGVTVGRIAGIINNAHNEYYKENKGFFGYFDCVNDIEISKNLFQTVESWLVKNGIDCMCGPINLTSSNESGLLIEGFETSPVIQMIHNPKYYLKLIEDYGFQKEIDLLAYQVTLKDIHLNNKLMQKLKRFNDLMLKKQNMKFRPINFRNFSNDLEIIRCLFNEYMSENWGFVPIDKDEFKFIGSSLRQIVVKELAFFIEIDNDPIGFFVAIPDINEVLKKLNGKLLPFGIFKYFYYKNKIEGLRVILMGIKKPFRKRGYEAVFYYNGLLEALKKGYKKAELSWISEKNTIMIQAVNNMNANLYKRYRVFNKLF